MAPNRRKKRDPLPLVALIEGELGRIDPASPIPLSVAKAWAPAVGPRVAQRTRPVRLRGETLYVRVNSSSWMNELQMLSPKILERLQERLGTEMVEELRFEIGPLPKPSVGIRTEKRAKPKAKTVASRPYPDAIETALDKVDDPELKEAIAEILSRTLED